MPTKRIYRSKGVPITSKGKWRSIEFECIFNTETDIEDFISWAEEKSYDKYITIKDDGSISENDAYEEGKEICVSFKYDNDKIVYDVCAFLKDKAYVNRSCGTHVHFDMRGIKKEQVEKFGQRLGRAVPALKQILPKSRRNNQYCSLPVNNIEHYNRYAFVNMCAYKLHKTIEVRGHSGTLNAKKILNWIKLLEKIMGSDVDRAITNPEEMIKAYDLGQNLKKFVNNRYYKVNNIKPPEVEEYNVPVITPVVA
jgi:Putative amidoligase enzyme